MMSSQCIVPKWRVRQQRQEEVEGEERNRSPHVQSHQNLTCVVPMCDNEVRELSWENGQLGVRWGGKPGDHTLASLVHQATSTFNVYAQSQQQQHSSTSNSIGKWDQNSASTSQMQVEQSGIDGKCSKRVRSESKGGFPAAESASATFCRDTDTTMMTWNSFESPRSLKTARTADDDSVYHDCSQENLDGERLTKGEGCRSQSSARRSRAAAIHNLSERKRRDRINEKMKALQKLVPNASKTDKASMLDEVIEYLKQLQAQVNMMSNARNMVMPLGMQQQLQMSLLARMGMGMGVLDVNNLTRNLPPSFPPLMPAAASPFLAPPFAMVKPNVDAAAISSDAYNTFLAQQSMNMELLNKVSAMYRQQSSSSQQPSKKAVSISLPLPNHDG